MDFRRADLGCVQWCQISLGKGAGVDHFRSKRSLLQLPLYPIGEVFPQMDLKPSLLAAQNLAGFDPVTNFCSTTKDNKGKTLGCNIYFNKML